MIIDNHYRGKRYVTFFQAAREKMGVFRACKGWKKGYRLAFAFLEVDNQASTYTRNQTDGSNSNEHSWERFSLW